MSGQTRGVGATIARGLLALVEPIYTAVVGARNHLFDREMIRIGRLPRPVISVGNITTGGTGKTPVVQWIVRELIALKHHPAVLTRGYKRENESSSSDEEQMLRDSLGVPIFADPQRYLAGQRALAKHPEIDAFVLDDGFQHRRLARDLDIVLIDATNPFGYDHVLPRGMLRESLAGLARVHVVILTRVDLAPAASIEEIESAIRSSNRMVPILRSIHRMDEVRCRTDAMPNCPTHGALDVLRDKRVWAFCGIGNPEAFENGLRRAGVELAGSTHFADHHPYEVSDLESLVSNARAADAALLLTTEKDFVKLRDLPQLLALSMPIYTVGVRIELNEVDTTILRTQIQKLMA